MTPASTKGAGGRGEALRYYIRLINGYFWKVPMSPVDVFGGPWMSLHLRGCRISMKSSEVRGGPCMVLGGRVWSLGSLWFRMAYQGLRKAGVMVPGCPYYLIPITYYLLPII